MPVETQQTDSLVLRDIHLPEPVSWWPPAPGWWILLALLAGIGITLFVIRKLRRRKRLQKSALAELETIRTRYREDNNSYALVQSLSILLRRACISFYPRSRSAGLTGEPWLDYLDRTSANNTGFKNGVGSVLATAPYLAEKHTLDIDAEALLSLCENWLQAQPVKHQDTEDINP